tara:strand:- start:122 stop:448 length:327 start_codon:yes stop_codon:yes gene_type:complete
MENFSVIDKNGGNGSNNRKRKGPPKPPPKYKVIYHNDEHTPVEFITWSLMSFFNKNEIEAQSIAFEIYKLGHALAGIYDFQIAEQKIYDVLTSAKENKYPLKVTGEPE